jgi:hypothetical protein
MIDVMIRALDVGRTSKLSSNYKFPTSTVNESASLITDKDVHQCKACGETDTLSPKLWKKRRDCPDDFEYPIYCKGCFEWSQRVPRWDRCKFLAAHPRPRVGSSSSHSVLHVAGSCAAAASVPAASTGPPSVRPRVRVSPQVSSSAAAASVPAASTGSPSARVSPRVSSFSAAAASLSASSTGHSSAQASPQVSFSSSPAAT